MENLSLFKNIKDVGINAVLDELNAEPQVFNKGKVIWKAGEKISHIGAILVGEIEVVYEDLAGKELLYETLAENEVFGAGYLSSGLKTSPYTIRASRRSAILFINFEKLFKFNENTQTYKAQLIKNIYEQVAKQKEAAQLRLYFLGKRTIREKLLSYLKYYSAKAGSEVFVTEFSREKMANYLCVDRSALCRELSNMQKEGLIEYKKDEFKVLF